MESPPGKLDAERRKKIEAWLGAGMGCCALRHSDLASLMQETLLKWHADRYRLLAWCIMPNHVHVLMETTAGLSKIVQSWKSYTGRWALEKNAELGLRIPGTALWMREYWDRYIRNAEHFDKVRAYIEKNPVAAGLCQQASDWPWSSASRGSVPRHRLALPLYPSCPDIPAHLKAGPSALSVIAALHFLLVEPTDGLISLRIRNLHARCIEEPTGRHNPHFALAGSLIRVTHRACPMPFTSRMPSRESPIATC